jgi:hypothetical protein
VTLRSLAWSLSSDLGKTDAEAKRAAQGFADHLNGVLNRTVSKSRLSVVSEKGSSPPHFDITRLVKRQVAPLELTGTSAMLLVQQKIEVEGDGHCATLTYSYRYQLAADPDSWVCRWEYYRKPPRDDYPYPLSHFHVNAALADREPLARRHFPTERVPLELVLHHLIAECGVMPIESDWQETLETSRSGFHERRTAP